MSPAQRLSPLVAIAAALTLSLTPALAQQEQMEQVEEVIVVTASRTEQRLHEVPAAVSVLTAEQIAEIPADDFGDLLRNIPGMNVSQMSARDINMTTRGATASLETAQLVLIDGRTLYLDFFGFVMWDFMPVNPREIKQIEVVRGPGSAVWGANAMNGVVNVITKEPHEMRGTSITLGAGELGTILGGITVAGAGANSGWKTSVGYYEQDAYDRPEGSIPGTEGPSNPGGTPYPAFENQGTEQPKVDLRYDYDSSADTSWRFSGGFAGTDGMVHTGIGPFEINDRAEMTYAKADWNKKAAQITFYTNILDGSATNLLAFDQNGDRLLLDFESDTYNLGFTNTSILGNSHILTYGANARTTDFALSIAPEAEQREEWGVFVQDEILLGEKFRWVIGGRYDDIEPLDGIFSPRTTFLYSPTSNNTFRLSYNEAFRAPSMINNYLEIILVNLVCLVPAPDGSCILPYIFPSAALGNIDLQEESVEAIELGWVGTFGANTVTLSVYESETTDAIDFFTALTYSSMLPPPNFPLPPPILDIPPPNGLGGLLPAVFSYRNAGVITNTGVEFSYAHNTPTGFGYFFNASWQDEPETEGIEAEPLPDGTLRVPVNTPPEWRLNAAVTFHGQAWNGSFGANYQDEAFWTDVLDSRFWGPTDSFTQFNAAIGYTFSETVSFAVDAQNLFDATVQQHVFGDIISRKVTGVLRLNF